MVDLIAEGEFEASEWGHMDNYIILPCGEDFGLGRQGWVAVRTGEEVGIRIGRARMIEEWLQQCESVSLSDLLFHNV